MPDLTFTSFSGTTRPTAMGIYDADADFQADADKLVYYVQRNMGTPVLDSEIDLREIWSAFEQATLEYSQTINTHHARNVLLDMLGQPTGSLSGSENIYPISNHVEVSRRIMIQYSHEAGVGGPYAWYTGSIDLVPGENRYDLWSAVSQSVSGAAPGTTVTIRKIHHYEPFASYRFFDTTSVLNFMGNAMNFESYSPETIFYLLPIWEDILRGTQLELNQRVRRSNYSFDITGYQLTVFPVPSSARKLYFEYSLSRNPNAGDPVSGSSETVGNYLTRGVTSNLSNIAFGHLGYNGINSIGKNWIWRMTAAFSKEIIGEIRSKYDSIPIPGAEVRLNGSELISRAREDQANLRQELREILQEMSYKNLLQEKNEIEDAAKKSFGNVPLLIYISH